MTNQKRQISRAYKDYLAYANGTATPKKARKFKKPSSPSMKSTLVTMEAREHKPSNKVVSPKNPLRKHEYESWGGSGDEANVKGDDEDVQDSDDKPQYVDDERTDYENQEIKDDKEETNDKHKNKQRAYMKKVVQKWQVFKDSSKGKSPATSSKSSKSGKSAKDQVKESIFVQDSDYAKHDDADLPKDQGQNLGKTAEQPNDEADPKNA
nr:hypothetical protein [Tanacetum cinerariifolium]